MEVPFINLERQYLAIKPAIDRAINDALQSFQFIRGAQVEQFELAFARKLGVAHCIGTGNGTDSLFLALRALGIGPGNEVITPAFSWISSSETITACGAHPVFADVDGRSYTLSLEDVEARVTPRTRAVIIVHLFGQAANATAARRFCESRNLFLIEDCAQAHLTAEGPKYAGTLGDFGCFSFYPTKNLGAYGDAGAVVTQDEALARKVRRLANHGAMEKDDHKTEGFNSRLDTLQAAILLAKLPHLAAWNDRRSSLAKRYIEQLRGIEEIALPTVTPGTTHSFHQFVIQAKNRNALKEWLHSQGIQTLIHFPQALHNLPAYRYLNHHPEDFPNASRLQSAVLSLPLYPELTDDQLDYVCDRIRAFYKR